MFLRSSEAQCAEGRGQYVCLCLNSNCGVFDHRWTKQGLNFHIFPTVGLKGVARKPIMPHWLCLPVFSFSPATPDKACGMWLDCEYIAGEGGAKSDLFLYILVMNLAKSSPRANSSLAKKIESTSKSSEIKLVDKLSPERQIRAAQENVSVRWDIGLNKKRIAYFYFTKEDNEARS